MTSSPKPKKLAIIDGKSVFYRGYMSMPNLSTKDGTPTGGVYGFTVLALELLKKLNPDFVCVAWDKPKTNIRKRLEIYPQYKAGRKPAPDDFYEQIPVLHELLEAFGWPLYEIDDYEADDIIGTLATKAAKQGIDVQILSSDHDMLQLVGPKIHFYAIKRGFSDIELFHPESFVAKYNLQPEQFLDLKALAGDSSDNIPGVPKIGKVTATKLLQEYKTLDGIYDNLDLISGKTQEYLRAGKDSAYMSKKLGAIWLDAPVELNLDHLDGSLCNPERVYELLQKLEFRSLVRKLPEVMQLNEQHTKRNVFEHGFSGKHEIIDADDKLATFKLADKSYFVYSRSTGKHGQGPQLLSLSPDSQTVYSLNLQALSPDVVRSFLNQLGSITGYDTKSTLKMFLELGVKLPTVEHDVLVGGFLINSLRRAQSLTAIAEEDLGYEGSNLDDLDLDSLVQRAPEIMGILRALYDQQQLALNNLPKVAELAKSVEWPVIEVLARMEHTGIRLDTEYLKRFAVEIDDTISDLQQQIYGYANQEFNISSPSQLADVLFEDLQLPKAGVKKGKTGYSTASKELDKLRGLHPIIDLITQYREVTKLKNTYVDTLPHQVDDNSRVHTTFNLTIAQTGRLSSTDPNLQNIPTRTDLGRRIRHAFVAGPGNVFVSADYSQFELRLAAVLANDQELIDLFNKGADIHTATAASVYGVKPEDVTKDQRRNAKVVNFGILYGMSPHGLSQATVMSNLEAKEFIQKYFELRKPIVNFMAAVKKQAEDQGYVETMLGRRRPTPDIKSSNWVVRESAYRQAINMPAQGTEADLMKMAMIAVGKHLADFPRADQLLQVHDSILIECPEEDVSKISKMLKATMENIYNLPVKLDVDVTTGKNWGEL